MTSSTSRANGSGVRFGADGLQAARLDLAATLPFATVAEQVGDGVRLYAVSGGLAGVERTATILGRDVTIRATGTVRADRGQLLIEPETVDLGGPSFVDSAASAAARSLVTIRQDVPGVPGGHGAAQCRRRRRRLRGSPRRQRRHTRPLTPTAVSLPPRSTPSSRASTES